ncbi:uncharacterized protein LOC134834592 [Culicoides brevitarsis]|uniref:uncharacterized protein LOC134834592 n=1 Tax=Culicoides brevitarsis TaxID=469753 RepID=UPI00307BE4B7
MFHKLGAASSSSRDVSTDDSMTLTNGSNSPDGTSISSLTWAEDAVRQTQLEWERIERILYGEEPLPKNDKPFCEEVLAWRRFFPELRVLGKAAKFFYSDNLKPTDPEYEEVFAEHPQTQSARTRQEFRESELEECLVINSGIATSPVPSLHHRTATIYKPIDNHPRKKLQLPSIMTPNTLIEKIRTLEMDKQGRVTRSNIRYRTYEPLITYSAKSLISTKLPQPCTNIFFRKDLKLPPPPKSAIPRIKQSVTLPAINVTTPTTVDSGIAGRSLDLESVGIVGRSISATNLPVRKHVKFKNMLPELKNE